MSEKTPPLSGTPQPTPPDTAEKLRNLRGNLLAYRDEPDRPESPRASRESAEEAVPEKMDEPEKLRMQACQEAVFRQYLNPSFYLYLKMTGKLKRVDQAFETAMTHPDKLHYRQEKDGSVTITRRSAVPVGKKVETSEVPDGFSMKMEGGYITRINGEGVDVRANKEYQQIYNRVISFISKLVDYIKLRENLKKEKKWTDKIKKAWLQEVMENVVNPNIDVYNAYMMAYPHRLIKCIESRNNVSELKLGDTTEKKLESYRTLNTAVQQHAHNALEDEGEETVEVEIRPEFPDYVFILDENGDDICAVTKEGYFVQQDEDENWTKPYEDYTYGIKKAYETKYR